MKFFSAIQSLHFALLFALIFLIGNGNPLLAQETNGCMECHKDTDLVAMDDGRVKSLFVDPKVIENSPHQGFYCADCHEGLDGEELPHADPIPNVDCLFCHDSNPDIHQFHPEFGDEIVIPEETLANNCADCHGHHDIEYISDFEFSLENGEATQNCGVCHETISLQYMQSTHAQVREEGVNESPSCITCHEAEPMQRVMSEDPLVKKQALVDLCSECHRDDEEVAGLTLYGSPFINAYENSVHGKELLSGNPDAPSCADCHDNHAVYRHDIAGSPVNRKQIASTCASCHEDTAHDYIGSIHARSVVRGNDDAPTCIDCHGEHNILHHENPEAAISHQNLSQQVCGECHSDLRISERYGMEADRYDTFADSFHGLATRGGAVEMVNCASCHGYHDVLSQDNPESLVHPDNLQKTCGECHPGANERFAEGKVHISTDRTSSNIVLYWIATIYTWAIVLIVGGMFIHNLLDFLQKVRHKVRLHRLTTPSGGQKQAERYFLRMNVNERIQHGVLALSFIILVITGFMLRYPDAWWVEALRNLSSHMFEWRGLAHRIAGVVMLIAGVWHVAYLAFTPRGRQLFCDLLPRPGDFRDFVHTMRYNLDFTDEHPRYPRFSYIEKLEYWALIWGSILMTVTGFLLWFESTTIGMLTKLGFDISRSIHFYEAILATLAIIVWHFYWVIFNPSVYPMNLAWLTGRMSEGEMRSEHAEYLDKLKKDAGENSASPPSSPEID